MATPRCFTVGVEVTQSPGISKGNSPSNARFFPKEYEAFYKGLLRDFMDLNRATSDLQFRPYLYICKEGTLETSVKVFQTPTGD